LSFKVKSKKVSYSAGFWPEASVKKSELSGKYRILWCYMFWRGDIVQCKHAQSWKTGN
jgi:hypothetical protein